MSKNCSHFYIHIPFCRQKCPYCKFALTPIFNDLKKNRYRQYLKKEITEYFSEKYTHGIDIGENTHWSIYFGGGTPSVLSKEEIAEILACFPFYQKNGSGQENRGEISFECNPEDLSEKYIEELISLGINRISVGIQSMNDTTLKAIYRGDRKTIIRAMNALGNPVSNTHAGISVNIDFILGLPHSRQGETLSGIQYLHEHFPSITHTSVYILEDELYPKEWKKATISSEALQQEFLNIMEYFQEQGWRHYELSNFSKPGYECRHNESYWNHSEYRGFGLSASSYEDNIRRSNSPSFHQYYAGHNAYQEILSERDRIIEKMMFGLRTSGWNYQDDRESGIFDESKINAFIESGLLEKKSEKIFPTKTGIFLLDHIMSEILR